jgi:holo-[acyl-carrier protein] synthase
MSTIGIDIIEIERIESAIERWKDRFLKRIYTNAELETYQDNTPALASHFAGKEAVMKALGTGIKGVGWREIEILSNSNGKPLVRLYGGALSKAQELNLTEFSISLSDTRQYAVAAVIAN